jgi:hypothetical protein
MIDFEIESDAFEHCVFTGDINDLPLHTQLNLVCKAVNASYEQRGTVIFFTAQVVNKKNLQCATP